MRKIGILSTRFALAASLTLLPVAMTAQTDSMSASSSNGATVSASDKKFVRDAAQGGLAEVELGKMATEKASNPDVKKFGQRMVDDHSKANDQLKQVASSKGITVPDKLNAKDEMTKQRLSKLSGDQFDKAYMSDMVKDHTQDVAEFQRESSSGADPDVKSFAAQTLPTLKDHLREAKHISPTTSASAGNTHNSQQ
jgi:putative membrane protein